MRPYILRILDVRVKPRVVVAVWSSSLLDPPPPTAKHVFRYQRQAGETTEEDSIRAAGRALGEQFDAGEDDESLQERYRGLFLDSTRMPTKPDRGAGC